MRFLEIGCYEGRATVWLLSNILTHESAKIDCLDIFLEVAASVTNTTSYELRFDYNVSINHGRTKVRKIKAASQEGLRSLKLYSYDAIYIDGSHTAADVLEDAVLAFRLLKPAGVLTYDDLNAFNGARGGSPYWRCTPDELLTPRVAIDSFLQIYDGQFELLAKGYQVAIRKNNDDEPTVSSA